MLWTSHLGFIGGGSAQLIIEGYWRFLVECYSLKQVKAVYWGTDIVWTSHFGFIWGGGKFSSSHFIFIGPIPGHAPEPQHIGKTQWIASYLSYQEAFASQARKRFRVTLRSPNTLEKHSESRHIWVIRRHSRHKRGKGSASHSGAPTHWKNTVNRVISELSGGTRVTSEEKVPRHTPEPQHIGKTQWIASYLSYQEAFASQARKRFRVTLRSPNTLEKHSESRHIWVIRRHSRHKRGKGSASHSGAPTHWKNHSESRHIWVIRRHSRHKRRKGSASHSGAPTHWKNTVNRVISELSGGIRVTSEEKVPRHTPEPQHIGKTQWIASYLSYQEAFASQARKRFRVTLRSPNTLEKHSESRHIWVIRSIRVTIEEKAPRHSRGKISRHSRGTFPHPISSSIIPEWESVYWETHWTGPHEEASSSLQRQQVRRPQIWGASTWLCPIMAPKSMKETIIFSPARLVETARTSWV